MKQILEEGGDLMTIVEKWMQEEREKGIQKGMQKVTRDVIRNSVQAGLSTRTIERITGLSVDEINCLKKKMAKEEKTAARKTH